MGSRSGSREKVTNKAPRKVVKESDRVKTLPLKKKVPGRGGSEKVTPASHQRGTSQSPNSWVEKSPSSKELTKGPWWGNRGGIGLSKPGKWVAACKVWDTDVL